jgi:hypothetical protein
MKSGRGISPRRAKPERKFFGITLDALDALWIQQLALSHRLSVTAIFRQIISALRLEQPIQFKSRVPGYLKAAVEAEKKRRNKLRDLQRQREKKLERTPIKRDPHEF